MPKDFDYSLADLKIKKDLQDWGSLGILSTNSQHLPASNLFASLILPMGYKGPAFLVYRNFRAILNWNRSILYALSVGILADKFIGKNLVAQPIFVKKISKDDIKFVQKTLNENGFNVGKVDGIVGSKTRSAVRKYQKKFNLPADGYIGTDLLTQMQNG